MRKSAINEFFTPVPKLRRTCSADPSSSLQGVSVPQITSASSAEPRTGGTPSITTFCPTAADPTASTQVNSQLPAASPQHRLDIGLAVHRQLTDCERRDFLVHTWVPPSDYQYPFSVRMSHGKEEKRFLKPSHLSSRSWLAFSEVKGGLFCKVCVLFAGTTGGIGDQPLRQFVTEPCKSYARLLGSDGCILNHEKAKYHGFAMEKAENFDKTPREHFVDAQLDREANKVAAANRQFLRSIIRTVILLGHQNLAFRGHRDSAQFSIDDEQFGRQQGNFNALLRYRAEVDSALRDHLRSSSERKRYISKTTQNELIDLCGRQIRDHIVKQLADSRFFTVIADETSDTSHSEQLSLCVRYVNEGSIHEEFLKFLEITDLTGNGIASTLLQALGELGIDLNFLVGQGYDGASAMSGHLRGAQSIIRESYPCALYTHCASHCLNLVLMKAADVQAIRNSFGHVGEVASFFHMSPKRSTLLAATIDAMIESGSLPEQKGRALKKLCETRWVEKHDSVLSFYRFYSPLVDCLAEMRRSEDRKTSSTADQLLAAITTPSFVVALVVMNKVMALTLPLSKALQTVNLDLVKCVQEVELTVSTIKSWRNSAEASFHMLFEDATRVHDQPLTMPRLTGRQQHRQNTPSRDPEEYYRRTIYIPFLDQLVSHFADRFDSHQTTAARLSCLVPRFVDGYAFSDVSSCLELYGQFLDPSIAAIETQYERWVRKWSIVSINQRPSNAIEGFLACDRDYFPDISLLLQVFATLPVTSATAERSFSTLKRLKTYLRSTMGEDRLNGLALMNIHSDVDINIETVIDEFAQKRRLVTL